MQKNYKKAGILTIVMILVVLVLRILITPRMMDTDTGMFKLSYIVIAVMALTMAAVAVLAGRHLSLIHI